MRRIRVFTLTISMPETVLTRKVTGFRATWAIALEALEAGADEVCLYDQLISKSRCVAVFCKRDYQSDGPPVSESRICWVSEQLRVADEAGTIWYSNLNTSDFAWCWVDGADRDIPFRLSFLERRAERNPNGPAAFGLGVLKEIRDLIRK